MNKYNEAIDICNIALQINPDNEIIIFNKII